MFSRISDGGITCLFALFTCLVLWVRYGYSMGGDDQAEILMLTLHRITPTFFTHDFFVQSMSVLPFHERSVAVWLLTPFGHFLPLACFSLHLLSAFGLVLGMFRMLKAAGFSSLHTAISVWLALLFFADRIWGADTLYYPYFQLSLSADALLALSLADFFRRKYTRSAILMSLAGIMQPVEVFFPALTLLLWWVYRVVRQPHRVREALLWVMLLIAGAGTTALALATSKVSTVVQSEGFQELFIHWRHPHHYLFWAQPEGARGFILFGGVFGFMFWNGKAKAGWFFRMLFVLFLLMLFLAFVLPNSSLFLLQPYKMTKWLHLLIVATGVSFFLRWLPWSMKPAHGRDLRVWGVTAVVLMSLLLWRKDHLFRHSRFDFAAGPDRRDEIDISRQCRQLTSPNAVFIVPPFFSAFPYYSLRSTYVSFKANPKTASSFAQWYSRIGLVYGIDTTRPEKGFQLIRPATAFYQSADAGLRAKWKQQGITHVVCMLPGPQGVVLLYKNSRYGIYRL